MSLVETVTAWITDNPVLAGFIGFVAFSVIVATWNGLSARAKVYSFYVILPAGFLAWSAVSGSGTTLYFIVFLLGMATAFAEILQKFRGEPLAALATWQGLLYHVLNGAIAAFALNLMLAAGVPVTTPLQQIQAVGIAGLGSMLVMRSKLFTVKVGDETIAVGPEQLINTVLGYLEHEIDRVRSVARIKFVKEKMENVKFSAVVDYVETMLFAAQALDKAKRDDLKKKIDDIKNHAPQSEELRSWRLGFLLLTEMGDDFVTEVFSNLPGDWRTRAPDSTAAEVSFLPSFLQRQKYVNLCVPDDATCRERLAAGLNWEPAQLDNHAGLRTTLMDVAHSPHRANGVPSFVRKPGGSVEVIVYKLPQEAVDYVRDQYQDVVLEEVTAEADPMAKAAQPISGKAFFDAAAAPSAESDAA